MEGRQSRLQRREWLQGMAACGTGAVGVRAGSPTGKIALFRVSAGVT